MCRRSLISNTRNSANWNCTETIKYKRRWRPHRGWTSWVWVQLPFLLTFSRRLKQTKTDFLRPANMVKFKSLTSPSVILLVLGSHVHAWLATLYQNIYISADRFLERTYTITSTAVVTGPVTPISTATTNGGAFDSGQQLTIIELYISGSNLLVSTPTRDSGVFGSSTPVTTSTISVRSVYFAEATITQPPTCVNTKFSYS